VATIDLGAGVAFSEDWNREGDLADFLPAFETCGFDRIDDVITPPEIDEITEGYRRAAGFALTALDDPTSLADRAY
jgi:hypothetical protein